MSSEIILDLYVPTPPVQVCEEKAEELLKKFIEEKRRPPLKRFTPRHLELAAYIYNAAYLEAHYEVWGAVEQILDHLIAEYTKDHPDGLGCKWDDKLAVWAYGKGFKAGRSAALAGRKGE